MANIKSQIKRILTNQKATDRNRALKSELRTAVREARKTNLELLLSNHDKKCLSCVRSTNCELQKLCREYGVDDENRYAGAVTEHEEDYGSAAIVRDNSKCALCRRCRRQNRHMSLDDWGKDHQCFSREKSVAG